MILNHVFVKLKSKTSNTPNKIGDVRESDCLMSQPSSYIDPLFQLQFHVALCIHLKKSTFGTIVGVAND